MTRTLALEVNQTGHNCTASTHPPLMQVVLMEGFQALANLGAFASYPNMDLINSEPLGLLSAV